MLAAAAAAPSVVVVGGGGPGDDSDNNNNDDDDGAKNREPGTQLGSQEANQQMLWIQRRRLDRDRAREPPAWLRERPIRRDRPPSGSELFASSSLASGSPSEGPDQPEDRGTDDAGEHQDSWLADASSNLQPVAGSDDGASVGNGDEPTPMRLAVVPSVLEDQPAVQIDPQPGPVMKPKLARRQRQSRQSNLDLYEEIVAHLVEEALDGRNLLADLYEELDSRAGTGTGAAQLQQQPLSTNPASLAPISGQLERQEQAQRLAGIRGGNNNNNNNNNKLLSLVPGLTNFKQQQPSASDDVIQVAGDEISNLDDVILVQPEQQSTAPGPANGAPKSLPLTSSAAQLELQAVRKQQQFEPTKQQFKANTDPQQRPDGGLQAFDASGLVDLLQSNLMGPRSEVKPSASGPFAGDQFHVLEDIDQVVDQPSALDQQQQQQQQQPLASPTEVASSDTVPAWVETAPDYPDARANEAETTSDLRYLMRKRSILGEYPPVPRTRAQFYGGLNQRHQSIEDNESDTGSDGAGAKPLSGDGEDSNSGADDDNEEDYATGRVNQQPVRDLSMSIIGSRSRQVPLKLLAQYLDSTSSSSSSNNSYQRTNPMNQNVNHQQQQQQKLANAIELIQGGYFSRSQLLRIAARLRSYLESSLELPKGSIVGLFPIEPSQLLMHLDQSKLEPADRAYLMRAAASNYNPIQGTLVIQWPARSSQNPLPVLSAILGALDDNGQRAGPQPMAADSDAPTSELAGADWLEQQPAELVPSDVGDLDALEAELEPRPLVVYPLATIQGRLQQKGQQVVALAGGPKELHLSATGQELAGQQQLDYPDDSPGQLQLDKGQLLEAPPAGWTLGRPPADQPDSQPLWALAPIWGSGRGLAGSPRLVSPAALMTYLNAVYLATNLPQQQPQLDPINAATSGAGRILVAPASFALKHATGMARPSASGPNHSHYQQTVDYVRHSFSAQLIIMMFALISSYLVIKLLARRMDKQVLRRRFRWARQGSWLWSTSRSTEDANSADTTLASPGAKSPDRAKDPKRQPQHLSGFASGDKRTLGLESGNSLLATRRLSADSGLETLGNNEDATLDPCSAGACKKRNLDLLSQRLLALLRPFQQSVPTADVSQKEPADVEAGNASGPDGQQLVEGQPDGGAASSARFRSSRSYIRSLIEALTKARSRVFDENELACDPDHEGPRAGAPDHGAYRGHHHDDDDDDDDEEDDEDDGGSLAEKRRLLLASRGVQVGAKGAPADDEPGGGIFVSQMDISAAHLILDYMEKHLEDKERLRREWLELNGGAGQQLAGAHRPRGAKGANGAANSDKATQLILQRLARVALSDQNRAKNRNANVVPFDRNRVRLGRPRSGSGSSSSSSTSGSHSPASTSGAGPAGGAPDAATRGAGDYINASFIYDADPRRPTHIIAQGPDEQTIGQFWQMIWEQEVSVIVMLTRLNENGLRQCHCYWPTGTTCAASPGAAGCADSPASPRQSGAATGTSTATTSSTTTTTPATHRRGSVTSVFSSPASAGPLMANGSPGPMTMVVAAGGGSAGAALGPPNGADPGAADSANNVLCLELPAAPSAACDQAQESAGVRLEVHLISEHVSSSDYLVRNMYLINRATGETRTITQFHYLAWPDGRVPDHVRSLLQFRRKVHKSYRNLRSPILVHCSDGAGRSGTYTLIDIILERIKNGAKEIDPRATLEHLRDQRVGLCATQSQFEFVLVALAEEIQLILNALPK